MNKKSNAEHHPLPQDDRARHDLIPESIERDRDFGDDAAENPEDNLHRREYKNPDGSPYPA